MLNKLLIKNFALIDNVEIIFKEGLNVLSGETGSGKSIILEALSFVLGSKADKTLIRSGENECVVTAEFDLSNLDWKSKVYAELDFEDDDILIITRKFNIEGKTSIKINGNTANVSIIKKFTSFLVDIHNQSEHFSLLNTTNQLALIDKFGGDKLQEQKNIVKNILTEYKEIKKELLELGGNENQRLIRLDVLNFQIDEIRKIDLKDGEEDKLLEIKEKLKYQEKILNALSSVKFSISNEGGIGDILSNSTREASYITNLSQDYQNIYERLSSVYSEIDDIASTCNDLIQSFDYNDYNYDEIENRLEDIKKLKKKYGNSYIEINNFLENAKTEKEKLENFNVLYEKLLTKEAELKSSLYTQYKTLREIREITAKSLSENILKELHELGMTNASFEVQFNSVPSINDCSFDTIGFDNIEFMFSANLGQPLKPLSYVISGGEMSRFMLAIKVQTSKYNEISTFVFDEIDAGISGVVAKIVGEKLVRISNNTQVIAISHLPQIVAFGDNNLLISKSVKNQNTFTDVVSLDKTGKIKEISRLIGSFSNNKTTNDHSINIIEEADKFKNKIK